MTSTRPPSAPAARSTHRHAHRPISFRTRLAVGVGLLLLAMLLVVLLIQNISLDWAFQHQVDTIAAGNGQAAITSMPDTSPDEVSGTAESCDAAPCSATGGIPTPDSGQRRAEGVVFTVRDGVVQWMRYGSIAVFVIAALLTMLLVWHLSGRLTARLDSISRQAAHLDPDRPTARISLDSPDAETASLAAAINAMLDRIEQSNDLQRSFIRNAGHELKTPITTIGTSLEALMAQNRFPDDVKPTVLHAIDANRTSAELITSLLELSRIQTAPDTRTEPVDPAHALCAILETHAEQIRSGGLTADTQNLAHVTVTTNPRYLTLVIDNLIRNAIVHNTDHGTITCSVRRTNGQTSITIDNTTAPPLTPADTTDLLQPFHRGDATRMANRPGHGLGLSIAQACADAIHATLTISRPTPGTFRAELVLGAWRAACSRPEPAAR